MYIKFVMKYVIELLWRMKFYMIILKMLIEMFKKVRLLLYVEMF